MHELRELCQTEFIMQLQKEDTSSKYPWMCAAVSQAWEMLHNINAWTYIEHNVGFNADKTCLHSNQSWKRLICQFTLKVGKCTLTHLHIHLFPPRFTSSSSSLPLPLSASLISSHCLLDCLSVFPCCYFRIYCRVFRSHAVSSPGKVWIMQTSLITPCANPLDWKSMCTQVAGKWMELTHQPLRQEEWGERGLNFIVYPKGLTAFLF